MTEIKAHIQTQNTNHINRTAALFSLESWNYREEKREKCKRGGSEGFMKLLLWSLHFQYFSWWTELQFGVLSFLLTCFSVNVAVISFDRRKPDKTEEEEPQDPCPYCSNEVPQTKLDCPECKNTIPYCIVTVSNTVPFRLVELVVITWTYSIS